MRLTTLSEAAVKQVATRGLVYGAVRKALEAAAMHDGEIFPVSQGKSDNGAFGIKAAYIASARQLGFKFGGYWPGNQEQGIPSHSSMTVLIDAATGFPRALINATYLNGLRTAAADAVAVDTLARKDANILGVLGAGHQAEFEIRAIADVRELRLIKLWNRSSARAERLAKTLNGLNVEILCASREDTIKDSDILVTITASNTPLVHSDEVGAGVHISAMGADQPGKQELDPGLVARAKLFADLPSQSASIGEFQHAIRAGQVDQAGIVPLGAVSTGAATGRLTDDDVTIFDSSGIAFQDVMVANAVLRPAIERGLETYVDL